MEYIEKEFPVYKMKEPEGPLNLEELTKLSSSVIEMWLKENIKKLPIMPLKQ